MYDLRNLKRHVRQTENEVECPVEGCGVTLPRMRKLDSQKDTRFFCTEHKITVTPSTFIYQDPLENILWKNSEDFDLYKQIAKVKRDKFRRNGHNNSEDALSWNVFRYIEKNCLPEFFSHLTGREVENPEIIYWTYDQKTKNVWAPIEEAWKQFELVTNRHMSEPDLILKSDSDLIVIEAKLKSSNNTTISPERAKKVKKIYVSSANSLFNDVFSDSFESIVFNAKKYELMRFWLLGNWIAEQYGLNFTLLNLVRARQERNIETKFGGFLKANETRKFRRFTWEQIYNFISNMPNESQGKIEVMKYLENRSLGYVNQRYAPAFTIKK